MKTVWTILAVFLLAGSASAVEIDEPLKECGLAGAIEKRIVECNQFRDREGGSFQVEDNRLFDEMIRRKDLWALLMRAKDNHGKLEEFWQDRETLHIWAEPFEELLEFGDANLQCLNYVRDFNFASRTLSKNWKIPSDWDFDDAWKDGIDKVLDMKGPGTEPEDQYLWWYAPNSGLCGTFDAKNGGYGSVGEKVAARCVTKLSWNRLGVD